MSSTIWTKLGHFLPCTVLVLTACSVTCEDGSEPDADCFCGKEQLDEKECVPADSSGGSMEPQDEDPTPADPEGEDDTPPQDAGEASPLSCSDVTEGLEGTISEDVTWQSGSTCVVTGDITVAEGATLTIEANTVVKFYSTHGFFVEGTLNAEGEEGRSVVFTSVRDKGHGRSTDDREFKPERGMWRGIVFTATAAGHLMHTEVHFAGTAITTAGSSPILESITIRDSNSALSSAVEDEPKLSDWDIARTGRPRQFRRAGTITGRVNWDQAELVQVLGGELIIAEQAQLSIGAGVVVKSSPASRTLASFLGEPITVHGTLETLGVEDNKVTITGYYDDSRGGDTNGDDGDSKPFANDWMGVRFESGSTGILNHTVIDYAVDVSSKEASLTLSDVGINYCTTALSVGPADTVSLSNITSKDCDNRGLLRRAGAITGKEVTWSQTALPNVLSGEINVASDAKLTLTAGSVVKAGFGSTDDRLLVDGELAAEGTAKAPVIFTSHLDDQHGSDVNGDEGRAKARAKQWAGIVLSSGASATLTQSLVAFAETGIANQGAKLSVIESTFRSNGVGLVAGKGAKTKIKQSSFIKNATALSATSVSVSATHNWWGDATGPSGTATGMGQPLEDSEESVQWEPALETEPDTP